MRKILSTLFVLILMSPAVIGLSGLDFDIKLERIGIKPPRFDARALFNNEYYRSFDQYVNDSFSLRSPLIFAKRWLDYHVFGATDIADVHVGHRGWLYSRESIEDYLKAACDDSAAIEQLVLTLHAMERMIEASGRRFIFTIAPNKSTIYPEFLGFVPPAKTCDRSRYDLLLETLERHPLKHFVRLDRRLQDAKQNQALLYGPTSAYWNALGAKIAANAIRTEIVQSPGAYPVFADLHRNPIEQNDLARRMMGFRTEIEDAAVVQARSSGSFGQPKAIVYGDGYIKNLIPYLARMFDRFQVIRAGSIPSQQHGEDWQAADIILLERAESTLAGMRLDIDKIFRTFEAEKAIPLRYPIDPRAFVPQTNVSLKISKDGLEIKSVGDLSSVALLSIAGSDEHVFRVLKLTVAAPHGDIMSVHFMTDPPIVARKALKPGISALYLPLPFQSTLSLNIHPGNKAAVLMLHSTEILALSDRPEAAEQWQPAAVSAKRQPDEGTAAADPDSMTMANAANPGADRSAPGVNWRDADDQSRSGTPAGSRQSAFAKLRTTEKNLHEKNGPAATEAKTSPGESQNEIGNSDAGAGQQKSRPQASTSLPAPITASPAIVLSDFEDGRIFQRQGNSANIIISGTYNGQIEAVEARVVQSGTLAEIVPWTVIDASPRNGIFVGRLAGVPQGGWYNIQIRSHGDHTVFDNGKHKWGVGMLIACLGQSNMREWFYTGNDLNAHSLLRTFSRNGWARLGKQGNAAIAFGNRIIEQLKIPVGLLDFAVNGSGLRKEADWGTGYWADTAPGSIYNRFVTGVSAAGGALEFVIWIHGEADAARGTVTENEYAVSLTHFIEHQVRFDLANGSRQEHLPFLVVMMIKRPGGKDQPHQAIRNAQKRVVETVADCYLAATTLDLKNHGRQHLRPKAYISMGNRVAQTVLYVLGIEGYYRGPQVIDAKQIDDHTVEIKIKHSGGDDFKPASGISGWEVIANNERVPVKTVYRHDALTIRIALERPLTGKATIRYLYGAMPDVSHPVMDNSPLSLPLEEFHSNIN